jgi:hypothetical protein
MYRQDATTTHIWQRQKHDYNALSPADRLYFSYVRGLAINLIIWINSCFAFKEDDKGVVYDIATQARMYLHRQVRAILRYKMRAEEENVEGVPNCTSNDIRRQVDLLFAHGGDEIVLGDISLTTLSDADTLGWDTTLKPVKFRIPLAFEGNFFFSLSTVTLMKRLYRMRCTQNWND